MDSLRLTTLILLLLAPSHRSLAQGSLVASIHGHATDLTGVPLTRGAIQLYSIHNPAASALRPDFRFPLDPAGDFHGTGIASGDYLVALYLDGRLIDTAPDIDLQANRDNVINFDLTGKEYRAKQSASRNRLNDDYIAALAKVDADNTVAGKVTDARAWLTSGDANSAIQEMQQALVSRPAEPLFWYMLGEAQSQSKQYTAAVESFEKGLTLSPRKVVWSPLRASVENNLAFALAQCDRNADAVGAYETAALYDPIHEARYYLNEAFLYRNLLDDPHALEAANKAIAADPDEAEAYYVRGQAMVGRSVVNSAAHKTVAPPGCIEAYQKYLTLAPHGRFAPDAKAVLAEFR